MEDLKEYLTKLRDNVDIVSVVSHYVKLKKRGRNYVGLCPFHEEKTPSFVVSPEKQIFHCFGCGASGDVVKFLMRIEDIDFKTAVKELANIAGIEPPHFSKIEGKDTTYEKKRLKEVMKIINEFFKSQLNSAVLNYLANRGVKKESIEKFQIGFAPNDSNKLISFAESSNISVEELRKVGLIRTGSDSKIYPYFWNRIIIPIFDLRGDIIAFGGRVFGEGEPKYLNSPDTVLFTKGNLLYPINFAKKSIREKHFAVVVEGYFDALILQQEEVNNAVSSMGTSFTDFQAKIIKRFADTVYFLYDDDAAGVKGAERAIEVGSKRGLTVRIAVPFEGMDPDEIVLKYGKSRIEEMLQSAMDPLDFIAQSELKIEGNTPQGRSRVIGKLVETISHIANKTEAYEYLRELSQTFNIDMAVLVDQYNTLTGNRRRIKRKTNETLSVKSDKIFAAERLLTQAVIQKPDYLTFINSQIDIDDFFDKEYKHIFLRAQKDIESGKMPDPKLWDDLSEAEMAIATELALRDEELIQDVAISQTIDNLRRDLFLRNRAMELFREFQETNDLEKLKEYNEVLRQLKGR